MVGRHGSERPDVDAVPPRPSSTRQYHPILRSQPRRQISRIQPSVQISPNHFHPLHLRTSAPIRYCNDTAATGKQARCPRPRRRGVGHGGGDGLFVRGGEHLLGNRIGEGAHQRDALGAANVGSNHAHCPLPNSRPQPPLGAIPSSSHAAATAVSTAPRLTLPREILKRPVRKLRHSARRGVEVDPSERQQLRATRSHSMA